MVLWIWILNYAVLHSKAILMTSCNTAVTPLLTHWSYCSPAQSRLYENHKNIAKGLSRFSVSIVPAGGLTPFGAAISSGTVIGYLVAFYMNSKYKTLLTVLINYQERHTHPHFVKTISSLLQWHNPVCEQIWYCPVFPGILLASYGNDWKLSCSQRKIMQNNNTTQFYVLLCCL